MDKQLDSHKRPARLHESEALLGLGLRAFRSQVKSKQLLMGPWFEPDIRVSGLGLRAVGMGRPSFFVVL